MQGLKSLFAKLTGKLRAQDDDLYGGFQGISEFASIEVRCCKTRVCC